MNVAHFDRTKAGILFFDILNGYYHGGNAAAQARMKPWVDNAVRLMKAGRAAGIPIIFAHGNHRPDGMTSALIITDTNNSLEAWPNGEVAKGRMHVAADDNSSEPIAELEPQSTDYFIPKYRWSAFFQTYLDLALRSREVDTLIISGGSTDVGVASTVYSGRDLDYNMIVVRDACGTSHDQRAHDALMDLMFPRMARVRTTDDVIRMIERGK